MFECATWRARLSTSACSKRWREAQVAVRHKAEELTKCRCCPTGAGHAGYPVVSYSEYYQAKICQACGVGTTRMISNRTCIGCYNRRREMRPGRNARGNVPVELMQRPLIAVEVIVSVDGEVRRIRDPETSGIAETMFQILRTTKSKIRFPCAPGWLPACAGGSVVEKALAVHIDEVEGDDLADVNGGSAECRGQSQPCSPFRALLMRTTGRVIGEAWLPTVFA